MGSRVVQISKIYLISLANRSFPIVLIDGLTKNTQIGHDFISLNTLKIVQANCRNLEIILYIYIYI